jgi:nucleoside-diphosphate-sugar epimerase
MQVLLTGHGTLGTPLAQRLIALGHEVRVLSRPESVDAGHEPPWHTIAGWLSDRDAVFAAVEGCDMVVHNGARIEGGWDLANHDQFIQTNVVGSSNLFQAAVAHRVEHLVLLSTDAVLGTGIPDEQIEAAGRARILRDDDPHDPYNIYDASKSAVEQLARYYRDRHKLSVTVLRPGWFPPPGALADHEFAWRLLGPCLWVGDVASAVLDAMDHPTRGEFLIHAAVPFVEADAAELLADPAAVVARYFPPEMEWWRANALPTPPIRCWADIAPARAALGFEPELNFADAVARMRDGKSPWPTACVQIAR